jgi:hypothetical protein
MQRTYRVLGEVTRIHIKKDHSELTEWMVGTGNDRA